MNITARRERIARPHFNIKATGSQNECLIFLYFKYSRTHPRLKYSIGVKVPRKYWDKKRGRVRETTEFRDWAIINEKLMSIEKICRDIVKLNAHIDHNTFKNDLDKYLNIRLIESRRLYPSFFEFIASFIDSEKNKPNAKSTWKKYQTLFNLLKTYCKDLNINELRYDDINWDFRSRFEAWSYALPRRHSQNTLEKNLNVIVYLMRRAAERSYLNEDGKRVKYHDNIIPFESHFGVLRVLTSRHPLNVNELNHLLNFNDLPQHLIEVKDLFLMSAFGGGYRYSDYTRMKKSNIFYSGDVQLVRLFITKGDTKMKDNEVIFPVFPEFKKLLEKYNYEFPPVKSSQKSNEQLKLICQKAGLNRIVEVQESVGGRMVHSNKPIWQLVTNHTARFSFITNALNHFGLSPYEVSKITGQSLKVLMSYEHGDKTKSAVAIAKKYII